MTTLPVLLPLTVGGQVVTDLQSLVVQEVQLRRDQAVAETALADVTGFLQRAGVPVPPPETAQTTHGLLVDQYVFCRRLVALYDQLLALMAQIQAVAALPH